MKTWQKASLIVVATVLVSVGLGFIPQDRAGQGLPPSQQKAFFHSSLLLTQVALQPPRALRACRVGPSMSQAEFIRAAVCLHHKHLLSTETLNAIKNDKGFATIGSPVGLTTISVADWWYWLTAGVGLTLLAFVVCRDRKARR